MAVRRPPRPTARYSDTRPYPDTPEFGDCENEDCERRARIVCPVCHGQYCHAHSRHPEHTASA